MEIAMKLKNNSRYRIVRSIRVNINGLPEDSYVLEIRRYLIWFSVYEFGTEKEATSAMKTWQGQLDD